MLPTPSSFSHSFSPFRGYIQQDEKASLIQNEIQPSPYDPSWDAGCVIFPLPFFPFHSSLLSSPSCSSPPALFVLGFTTSLCLSTGRPALSQKRKGTCVNLGTNIGASVAVFGMIASWIASAEVVQNIQTDYNKPFAICFITRSVKKPIGNIRSAPHYHIRSSISYPLARSCVCRVFPSCGLTPWRPGLPSPLLVGFLPMSNHPLPHPQQPLPPRMYTPSLPPLSLHSLWRYTYYPGSGGACA